MEEFQQYTYQPVTKESPLRLFELFAFSSHDAPLHGSIIQTSIDKIKGYEALSYMWGDDATPSRIFVEPISWDDSDGSQNKTQILSITENLDQALRLLRLPTRSRLLWIDAICINQRDINEKEELVPQMRKIYADAEQVVVCLGKEWFDSGCVPLAILAINHSLADGDQATGFSNLDQKMQEIINTKPAPYNIRRSPAYMWENFRSWLYDRGWFLRVWVIQEVALAKKSIVVCGSWELSGKYFFQTLSELNKHVLPPSISKVVDSYGFRVNAALEQIHLMRTLGAGEEDYHPKKLIDLLQLSRGSSSTKPHDYIYALFGLASDINDTTPPVNYTEPWQETFKSFTLYFIRQGYLKDVLLNCFAHHSRARHSRDTTLPSWVPDWTIVESVYGDRSKLHIPFYSSGVVTSSYNAGSSVKPSHNWNEELPNILEIRGHLIMKIKEIGKQRPEPLWTEPPAVTSKLLLEVFEEIKDFFSRESSVDADLLEFMTWRTLVCDQHWRVNRALEYSDWNIFYLFALRCASLLDTDLTTEPPKEDKGSERGQRLIDSLTLPILKKAARERVVKAGDPIIGDFESWKAKALKFCFGNSRCLTDVGSVGQVPLDAKAGDMIAIFEGVPVPFVLRPREPIASSRYEIIGACYFFDLMAGQAMNAFQGQNTVSTIKLA